MYIILTASPNADGLTAACGLAAKRGMERAGGEVALIDLCAKRIGSCRTCGNGWGQCRGEGQCVIEDCLQELQQQLLACEGLTLVTPVYWGQPAERMKFFLDRYRRCEAFREGGSGITGKRVNLVAAAGGSGNGTLSCLEEMERWCRHLGAVPFERNGITRFNREGMLAVIEQAAADMAAK